MCFISFKVRDGRGLPDTKGGVYIQIILPLSVKKYIFITFASVIRKQLFNCTSSYTLVITVINSVNSATLAYRSFRKEAIKWCNFAFNHKQKNYCFRF